MHNMYTGTHTQESYERWILSSWKDECLSFIIPHARKLNPDLEITDEDVDLFKKFMYLCAEVRMPIAVISEPVDALWHSFILHSTQYWNFCTSVGDGSYIHHVPNNPKGTDDQKASIARRNVVQLMKSIFNFNISSFFEGSCDNCNNCRRCYGKCHSCCNQCYYPGPCPDSPLELSVT